MTVTVAIPVRNGGAVFHDVLRAVRAQELGEEIELIVCDSSSSDGSPETAREHGAEVVTIEPASFSHGATRNMLVERAAGDRVAFLTQDAVPAEPTWLAQLLSGFALADDIALSYGPYRPRPGASQPVARELREWFAGFGAVPRVDRLAVHERALEDPTALGPRRAFFTDANGCVLKSAWREVPFREVRYAEDQQLALDMMRAGYAKAYVPGAAVVHSHEYAPAELLRRAFDEWRALHEVYGLVEPIGVNAFRGHVTSRVRADARDLRSSGAPLLPGLLGSVRHHLLRWIGALLGSRAPGLPAAIRRRLSLEGRA